MTEQPHPAQKPSGHDVQHVFGAAKRSAAAGRIRLSGNERVLYRGPHLVG